jgi:DNA (cytosine-5)-methyltransferase 1
LDLHCGAGGAGVGYKRAGFTQIVGVDIKTQPRYPFTFVQGDVNKLPVDLSTFDFIHASPVCKGYSSLTSYGTNRSRINNWPDQIAATRQMLRASGKPYCIENVSRAPLETDMLLCGQMFGLPLIRHRLFETNFGWLRPFHVCAPRGCTRLRSDDPRRVFTICGNGGGKNAKSVSNRGMEWRKADAQRALGIDWMTRAEMREAVPPIYTEFIGRQFLRYTQELKRA